MIFVVKFLIILCGVIFSTLVYQVAKARALLSCGILVDQIRVGIGPGFSLSFPPFFGRMELRFCLFPIWVSLDVRKVDLLSLHSMSFGEEASVRSSGIWASLVVGMTTWFFGIVATMSRTPRMSILLIALAVTCLLLIACFRFRQALGFASPALWLFFVLFIGDDAIRGDFFRSIFFTDIPFIAKWITMRIKPIQDFLNVVMYSSFGLFAVNLLPIPFFDGWELLLSVISLSPREDVVRSHKEAYPHAN